MKVWMSILIFSAAVFSLADAGLAQDRFNPPYPRIGMYSTSTGGWPSRSLGSRLERIKQYDMVLLPGTTDLGGPQLAAAARQKNPNQIIIGMGVNGLWYSDPPPYYMYRSYRGHLKYPIQPGQRIIIVDSTQNINPGNVDIRFMYIEIDGDIIALHSYPNDTTLIANITDPNDFYAVSIAHPAGAEIKSPLRLSGASQYPNFSQWCPTIDGKTSWRYLAEKNFLEKMPWGSGLFDGFFHDYFHPTLYVSKHTMDMNLNGKDDYTEWSSTSINNIWRTYLGYFVDEERGMMQSMEPGGTNLFSVNAGGSMPYFHDKMNGHLYEGFLRFFTKWTSLRDDALTWMAQGLKPSVMFIEDFLPEKWSADGKNRFNTMRFGLTTALMFDCYYGMAFGDTYYIMLWYDEFETNLGYPTGPAKELPNGLWVRFFDEGVAICNPTGVSTTLTAGDLQGLSGYNPDPAAGYYYRLKGGQDPVTNNGQLFNSSLTLFGVLYTGDDLRGDGILLFKKPTVAVSDIIVDNYFHNDTSPGSDPVILTGKWNRYIAKGEMDIAENNPYWGQMSDKLARGEYDESYGYHATTAGTGADSAVWKPTIGVPGYYEISEWHGWHGDYRTSYSEATNVPFKIITDKKVLIRGIINQQMRAGQWNRLGFAYLSAGKNAYVHISNKADNWVIADAMRFKYLGENAGPDTTPPQPPQNVRIIQSSK